MPTLLKYGGYRFFMYAGDRDEPPHIHVEQGTGSSKQVKFWLSPIKLDKHEGFSRQEIKDIKKIIEDHHDKLIGGWYGFFYPQGN